MRLWIGLVLIAICASINQAQSDEYDWYGLEDSNLQSQEYEYQVSAENKDDDLDRVEEQPEDGNKNVNSVDEDFENFYKSLENVEDKPDDSVLNDYQFEDNRSEPKDEQNIVPLNEQKDAVDAPADNENNILNEKIEADYNNPSDTNQYNDANIYDMNENSIIKPLENENQSALTKHVLEAEEDNETQPLDTVDDILNKVFDDSEIEKNIQENIESIEQTNQLVNDLAGGITSSEKLSKENVGNQQSEEMASKHEVEAMNIGEDYNDFQKKFNQEVIDNDNDIVNSHENDEDQYVDKIEVDNSGAAEEQEQSVRQHGIQNEDINSEEQIFEETINEEIENKNNKNEELSNEFEEYAEEGQALSDENLEALETNDDDKLDKNDEDQSVDETKVGNKGDSQEQEQSVVQDGVQNGDINSEGQIFEENTDEEIKNKDEKNEELSNEFQEYVEEGQAPNDENFEAVESNHENISEEDTYDRAYADLNDDLKKLFETWDKLQDDDTIKEDEDGNILDYEEKYNKPYRESNILSVRENDDDEEEDFNEEGLETKNDDGMDIKNNDDAFILNATIVLEKMNDKEDVIDNDETFYRNGSITTFPETTTEKEVFDESFYRNSSTIFEENDEIKLSGAETEDEKQVIIETSTEYDNVQSTIKSIAVDNLTPDQYDDLMKQFSIVHIEELAIKPGDNVAPIHISLSADEAVVIESPDYPNNYPTNNVIDYYFSGLGSGIEFNITDFSVNGILGDYLLVKPGGIDASGNDGLVFSYHLNRKRQYRFLNVDRLFVRFFAHPGNAMFKGYQFSVKMISPPEEKEEVQPEPEPLLPPLSTHTVALGGTSLEEFSDIEEDFRLLIADMATMYINANNIDSGLNSTSETAQITKTSLCNVNWPGFESCVAVTFGVPLEYEDGRPTRLNESDLSTMWGNYVWRDPFAARLRRLGITEFDSPNDRRVLTVWLVIAAGVVISMAMLAFALWRFSCFEDYTRMAAYSDTDSINDKRVLDMYPTPHQTFPALYSEQQLKWDDEKFDDTTRVDMGGYANRSYVRDDVMDVDSDEEIVTTPRDRNSFSPRDIYQV